MLINDTTVLLDKSFELLKHIHNTQYSLENIGVSSAQEDELSEDEQDCRFV